MNGVRRHGAAERFFRSGIIHRKPVLTSSDKEEGPDPKRR